MPEPTESQQRYPRELLILLLLFEGDIERLMYQVRIRQVTLDTWQTTMLRLLTRNITAAALLGLNSSILSDEAAQAVSEAVIAQVPYLSNFSTDMATKLQAGESDDSWDARAKLYASAIVAPFWKANTRFLQLPAYPADGTSECLMNDRCLWWLDWVDESNLDVDAYWITEKDRKVCGTCATRGRQWYPLKIRKGVVPK